MSESQKNLAVLRDYIERSTHWREGGATRHDALKVALPALEDDVDWINKGIVEWRDAALTSSRQAEAARATARIAIAHLQATLISPADPRYAAAFESARDWLTSIGSD